MRAEELDNLTEKELQAKANGCFIQGENTNINLQGGAEERLGLQLEAQYYLTLVARKRDEHVAWRDFWMEVAVIVLIGLEIILSVIFGYYGVKEGKQQAAALQHMDRSTFATAKTLENLQTAQRDSLQTLKVTLGAINDLNAKLTNEATLLSDAQKSLRAQLDLTRRQFEAQNKHPVLDLRVLSWLLLPPQGYETLRPKEEWAEINLVVQSDTHYRQAVFILRNIGTATAANVFVKPRASEGVTIVCVDYPALNPNTAGRPGAQACAIPSGALPPIPLRPKDRPVQKAPSSSWDAEFDNLYDQVVRVNLQVAAGITQFQLELMVGADGIAPTRYLFGCHSPSGY